MDKNQKLKELKNRILKVQKEYDAIKLPPAVNTLSDETPQGNIVTKKQVSEMSRVLKKLDKAKIEYNKHLLNL